MLPVFERDQTVVVEERWHELLWSAVPQRVIDSSPERLVTFVPAGTTSVVASNRGLPGTENLTRSERKLRALKDLRVQPLAISESPTKLYFYTADRWARVNLGWDPADGRFMGWYVNFEQPVVGTSHGLRGKDLVLDLYVNADRTWQWKDQEDFNLAVSEGVLSRGLRAVFDEEARRVLAELDVEQGPFAPHWQAFHPEPDWDAPRLPDQYEVGGELGLTCDR